MIIWLVGRTNVGKSTLFNRILWTYRAIVTDIAGTTRELLRDIVDLDGRRLEIVDSPWLADFEEELQFISQIINESDIVLFVVDGKGGVTQQDERIKELIVQAWKKHATMLVVNKLDKKVYRDDIAVFLADRYQLGFEVVIPLSAQQHEWFEDFYETLRERIGAETMTDDEKTSEEKEATIPLAIIGRPNAGKSTLLNTLSGEYVAHVQDLPWTTLDYITSEITRKGERFMLYDTAGIRKKGRIEWLERIAYEKTLSMLKYIKPIVILLMDINEGMTQRDKTLFDEIVELWLPTILVVNKIDSLSIKDGDQILRELKKRNVFLQRVPIVKISGKEAIGLPLLLSKVKGVREQRHRRISTSELNRVLTKARVTNPPRFPKNKICKRKYITQVEAAPPTFMMSVNNEEYANFSFKRRCENVLRTAFNFGGVPIQLKFSSKVKENPYLTK